MRTVSACLPGTIGWAAGTAATACHGTNRAPHASDYFLPWTALVRLEASVVMPDRTSWMLAPYDSSE